MYIYILIPNFKKKYIFVKLYLWFLFSFLCFSLCTCICNYNQQKSQLHNPLDSKCGILGQKFSILFNFCAKHSVVESSSNAASRRSESQKPLRRIFDVEFLYTHFTSFSTNLPAIYVVSSAHGAHRQKIFLSRTRDIRKF